MKRGFLLWLALVLTFPLCGATLPVITGHPQSQIVTPGSTATFSATATGATGYQWRLNGTNLAGATGSTLQILNAQYTNAGYYLVLATNSTGVVPSRLGYLGVVATSGKVPFSNKDNSSAQARFQCGYDFGNPPISNGVARIVAGPTLDQMKPLSLTLTVSNGFYNFAGTVSVPSVEPGQDVYYRVDINYVCHAGGFFLQYTQQSTVLKLTAGGGVFATPNADALRFPTWPEWPEPSPAYPFANASFKTNQVRVVGESTTLTNRYIAYTDFGTPKGYWRKDGKPLSSATNLTLIGEAQGGPYQITLPLTGLQGADAGFYDVVLFGNNWLTDAGIALAVQTFGGQGVFASPRNSGTNFVVDLQGAAGRNYAILWSSNLSTWNNLFTVSNATGSITFTNGRSLTGSRFFRSSLLP